MYRVQLTALALGIVLLATRLPGIFSPKKFVRWIKEHILSRDDAHLRFYGLAIAVIGAFLIYLLLGEVDWLEAITMMVVLCLFIWGLFAVFFPDVIRAPLRAMIRQPPMAIRIVCTISAIIALFLIRYGILALQ